MDKAETTSYLIGQAGENITTKAGSWLNRFAITAGGLEVNRGSCYFERLGQQYWESYKEVERSSQP